MKILSAISPLQIFAVNDCVKYKWLKKVGLKTNYLELNFPATLSDKIAKNRPEKKNAP